MTGGRVEVRSVVDRGLQRCSKRVGLKTQRHLKGVTVRTVTPWFLWLRGADLNRRPLGYEGNFGEDSALLSTAKYP